MRVIAERAKIETLTFDDLFTMGNTLYRFICVAIAGEIPVIIKREHPEKGYENISENVVRGITVTVFKAVKED